MAKRKDGWQALLQQISDKYREYGFDSRFYRSHFGTEGGYADDEVWEKMVDDWEDAFQLKMHEEKEKEIAFRKDALERRLRSNLKDIPEYIRQNRVDKDEFFQTWGMMSGLWNTVDFERIRKIVRIQRSCPEIVKVARKMGRMADDEGREQIRVAEGNVYKMEHSSKCDILGISTGNDLNTLFPLSLPIPPTANWKICSSTNTSPASSRPSAINRKSCSLPGVSKPSPPVPKVR